jgi:hypothetical protein
MRVEYHEWLDLWLVLTENLIVKAFETEVEAKNYIKRYL